MREPLTSTMPPYGPGSRRVIPIRPGPKHAERLRDLLEQDDCWVLRGDWERWLEHGSPHLLTPISELTRDQCAAAVAWLVQQQHALYESIYGSKPAPDGWIEEQPLYRALHL